MFSRFFAKKRPTHIEDLDAQVKNLRQSRAVPYSSRHSIPTTSGVYVFTLPDGSVAYVGTAKNLRRRVNSQFSGVPEKGEPKGTLIVNMMELAPRQAPNFNAAKDIVASCTVQFLEVANPRDRTKLENYAKVWLQPLFVKE